MTWEVAVCSECGVRVDYSGAGRELVPVDGCGDPERRCGMYTQATPTSTGPVNDVPGVRAVTVVPVEAEGIPVEFVDVFARDTVRFP